MLCLKQYHSTTVIHVKLHVVGVELLCNCSGNGWQFIEVRAESSWQLKWRGGGNTGSQEHPTHRCCLLLSPQSGHFEYAIRRQRNTKTTNLGDRCNYIWACRGKWMNPLVQFNITFLQWFLIQSAGIWGNEQTKWWAHSSYAAPV